MGYRNIGSIKGIKSRTKAGRPKKIPSLAEFGISDDLIARLGDLREGYCGAPEHRVVAQALEHFLANRGIDFEPEVKKRYLMAQQHRLDSKK
jgi:hypothetical protein